MPGTLNNRLILRDKYIRDTALSEGDLKEQLVEARAQLAVAVAALKAVEWIHDDMTSYCPWCLAREPGPHNEGCQRQAAIAAVEWFGGEA